MTLYTASLLRIEGQLLLAEAESTDMTLTATVDGAAQLTVGVIDPHRRIVRSQLLRQKSVTAVDGVAYTLRGTDKDGAALRLNFVDSAADELMDLSGLDPPRVQPADTGTRGEFIARLFADVGWAGSQVDPGEQARRALAVGSESDPDETWWDASGRVADDVGWRRFAYRNVLTAGSDEWLTGRTSPLVVREHRDGVDDVNFAADVGLGADQADLSVDADLWAAPVGSGVVLDDLGVASGLWIVSRTVRPGHTTRMSVELSRPAAELAEPPAEPEPEYDPGDLTVSAQGASPPRRLAADGGAALTPDFVPAALKHNGLPYRWGANGPNAYDCSSHVQSALRDVGVTVPRTSKTQFAFCRDKRTLIEVADGIDTYGALLFRMIVKPGEPTHVAISRGDGSTIEARGSKWGVGVFPSAGRGWSHAALVPGVRYA